MFEDVRVYYRKKIEVRKSLVELGFWEKKYLKKVYIGGFLGIRFEMLVSSSCIIVKMG